MVMMELRERGRSARARRAQHVAVRVFVVAEAVGHLLLDVIAQEEPLRRGLAELRLLGPWSSRRIA